MNISAVDWTAVGSIATGLAIAATFLVYLFQSWGNKASAIRQNLQFIHSQQTQVTRSIESGFLATIERQIREFRQRLGSTTEPSYFLDQLFGNGQAFGDRSLFRASALESNLSSTMYIRMSDIWDGVNIKAFEFRGALRIFSYVSLVMTGEARRLCDPVNTTRILDIIAKCGARETLDEIHSLDEVVNTLLSDLIKQASGQLKLETNKISQGCELMGLLADKSLLLSDRKLRKLARKNVRKFSFNDLEERPRQAIEKSLGNLRRPLRKDFAALCESLDRWFPQSADTVPAEPHPPEKEPPRSFREALHFLRGRWSRERTS